MGMRAQFVIPVLASILILGVIGLSEDAWAPTKIAPTKGEPGHPFTVIDTPEGRLAEGSVCMFTLNGSTTEVDLKTNKKGKTAKGTVPEVGGGTYEVSCRLVDGTTFAVGAFEVDAPPALPDTEPPIITASTSPTPNVNGWNDTDVTVSFACNDALSGIASITGPVTITTEGSGQVVTGTCVDLAGNSASTSVTVNIDQSAPNIAASISPTPNVNGWNNSDVTVSFACNDALSGIASITGPVTITTEGAGQVVTGTCVDLAGNTASTSVTVNIDKTPPNIAASVDPAPDGDGVNNSDVTVSFACNDSLSGIASITGPIEVTADGETIVSGTCTDLAGNTASTSVTVNIVRGGSGGGGVL